MFKPMFRLISIAALCLSAPGQRLADAAGLQADLSVVVLDTPDPVIAGAEVEYVITATNLGPAQAINVIITDTLPSGLGYVSITPSSGCGSAAGVITCTLATLDSGASVIYTLVAEAEPDARGAKVNSVAVTSAIEDPDANNNAYTAVTHVEPEVDLRLTAQGATPATAIAGATLIYTFTVENLGRSLATSVILTDTLPVGQIAAFVGATPGFGCGGNGAVVTCTIGAVAPVGASGPGWISSGSVLTVSVTPRSDLTVGTQLFNTATIDATEPETSAANNTVFTATDSERRSDLAVQLDGPVGLLHSATAITYTLTLTNAGPSVDDSVVVTGSYPAALMGALVSDDTDCTASDGVVYCLFAAMAVGDHRMIHFTARPMTVVDETLIVSVSVDGNNPEPIDAIGVDQATTSTNITPYRRWLPWISHP